MASVIYPSLAKKTSLKDGSTYGYAFQKASDGQPTLLFLHGYPSSSYMWQPQVEYFSKKGYGLVVPDLLGYGDTTKPDSFKEYGMKRIGENVEEILDQEGLDKVIGIAHDWGCGLMSSMARYSPKRFSAFTFSAVGYVASAWSRAEIEKMNGITQDSLGYPVFGYWLFHDQDDAAEVINKNHPSYASAVFAADPMVWPRTVSPIGELRKFTESGQVLAQGAFYNKATFEKILLGMGGYNGPLNWYKQAMRGVSQADEEAAGITDADRKLHVPTLYLRAEKDYICLADAQEKSTRDAMADVSHLTVASLNTSHWITEEQPDNYNLILERWLQGLKI